MPKLLTPIQYEDTLDELNIVRPLELADVVKHLIDIPILNSNSVDNNPALGKLLRCDNAGALLIKNSNGFKHVEAKAFYVDYLGKPADITFAQPVERVLYKYVSDNECYNVMWVIPALGNPIIKTWPATDTTWIEFNGTTIRLNISGGILHHLHAILYGFYN